MDLRERDSRFGPRRGNLEDDTPSSGGTRSQRGTQFAPTAPKFLVSGVVYERTVCPYTLDPDGTVAVSRPLVVFGTGTLPKTEKKQPVYPRVGPNPEVAALPP